MSTRKYVGLEYPSWSEPLRSLRIRYWYEVLRQQTGLSKAYQMEQFFEPESFARDTEGSIQYYKNKWVRYEDGRHLPHAALLMRVEAKAPGSTRELHHPLWAVLDLNNKKVMHGDAFLRQLAPAVQSVLFKPGQAGLLSNDVRVPITPSRLKQLEQRACLDVLACLVWLLREAAEQQNANAVAIGRVLHNVLTMMALELEALKVGLSLLRLFIDLILPLGVAPHHRIWMTPSDYLHASGHLNRLVYGVLEDQQQSLSWNARAKLMHKLLKGDFGMDVHFAMSPQLQLDETSGQISAEVVSAHNRASRLRNWGWKCISSGLPGRVPPPELFR